MSKSSVMDLARHSCYVLSLLLLFVLQTTPGLLSLWGVKPVLLVPAAVCIAAVEGEFIGGVYGAFAGLLCDLSASSLFGMHAILLLCCCVVIGLLLIYLVRRHVGSVVLFSLVVLTLRGLLDFLLSYAMWGYEGSSLVLVRQLIPVTVYSSVMVLPLFYFYSWLSGRFFVDEGV